MTTTQHPFRAWRLLASLTLEACAPQLGVTFQHLGNVEKDSRKPSVDLVLKMESMTQSHVTRDMIADFHGLKFATGLILVSKEDRAAVAMGE